MSLARATAPVLVLVLALCADLALIRVGLDPQDEGYFVDQAGRMLRGDMPYRDFDSLYTPALLYLHAGLFNILGGPHVLIVRAVGWLARCALSAGLYVLCRPLARPLFAVLPALYVLVGLDTLPIAWEPHPGWPSAALSVIAVCAFTRLPSLPNPRRGRSLIAIGVLAALVFAFKQNAGVFLGLALLVFTAWQDVDGLSTAVTPAPRAIHGLLLLVALAAGAWLIHPHANPLVAGYFLVPLAAAGVASLWTVGVAGSGRGVRTWLAQVGWLGVGFCLVTLPWLAALIWALGGHFEQLSGFVGVINQDLLWLRPDDLSGGALACLFGSAVALTFIVCVRNHPALCAIGVAFLGAFAASGVLLTRRTHDAIWQATLFAPGRAAIGLPEVLPIASIIVGAWYCLRAPPSQTRWRMTWLTVASALMLLAEYPRMDEIHLAWSACLALATGAVVLDRLYTWLTERWSPRGGSRGLLLAALLVVPVASTLPNLAGRSEGFLVLGNGLHRVPFTTITGLAAVDGVVIPQDQTDTMVATARFVVTSTAHGEPIFVYPSSPLMYAMTDRPNPTRFEHLYPGAASTDQLAEIIATLRQRPVCIVVVSDSALALWGPPGANQPLEEYLASQYSQVAHFGDYRVLSCSDGATGLCTSTSASTSCSASDNWSPHTILAAT